MKFLTSLLIACCAWQLSWADVRMPALFSDNMVLQRDKPVTIWGTADKDEKIMVSFHQQSVSVIAGKDGKWNAVLAAEPAGGPYALKINGKNHLQFNNVLVGDVWICSGQSNMEMPFASWGKINNYEEEIAQANYPDIRLLHVQHATAKLPAEDVQIGDGGIWHACSPASIPNFSATAYFFAREVQRQTGVPIGLILTTWGGTVAEAWMSGETLKANPDFAANVVQLEKQTTSDAALNKAFEDSLRIWHDATLAADAGWKNGAAPWAADSIDFSHWKLMPLPGYWELSVLPNFDGIVWLKKNIHIPDSWAGKELKLSLCTIDDEDITYFNGTKVGECLSWNEPRVYKIPASLAKAGDNIITIRITDNEMGGGMFGKEADLFIQNPEGERISLVGNWNYKVSVDFAKLPKRPIEAATPNRPTVLYNAMVSPLLPFTIKGFIWYQGESNADRAYQYRTLFPSLITDWRKQWKQGDLPFYFVQLAGYGPDKADPAPSAWAELREAQARALALPNTGMAVAIDLGSQTDIHPKNKQETGRRLALQALAKTYGKNLVSDGPVFKSLTIDADTIILTFSDIAAGLKTIDGTAPKGFAIAAADRHFQWAEAKIAGDKVKVWAHGTTQPVAVRYAWSNTPSCNLVNSTGLPASPFRTDDWEMTTRPKK